MAQPFSHLRDKMSPERQARVEVRVQQAIQEMALAELWAARDLTQEHLSGLLGVKQSAISVVGQFGVNIASMLDQLGRAWTVNMKLPHYRNLQARASDRYVRQYPAHFIKAMGAI